MTLAQLLLFLPAAAIVAVSPGANNLLAFANGSRQGLLPTVVGLSGRCTAFALMIAMVIVGLGALLEASEPAFQIIKWVGVLYLAYLGVRMMIGRDCHEDGASVFQPVDAYSLARRGVHDCHDQPQSNLALHCFCSPIHCCWYWRLLHCPVRRFKCNLHCGRVYRRYRLEPLLAASFDLCTLRSGNCRSSIA